MKLAVIGENFEFLQNECYSGERSVKINNLLTDYLMDYRDVIPVTNLDPGVGFIWSYLAMEENLPLIAIIPSSTFSTDFCEFDKNLYNEMLGYRNIEVIIHSNGDVTAWKLDNRNRHIIANSDVIILLGDNTKIKDLHNYGKYIRKEIIRVTTAEILKL